MENPLVVRHPDTFGHLENTTGHFKFLLFFYSDKSLLLVQKLVFQIRDHFFFFFCFSRQTKRHSVVKMIDRYHDVIPTSNKHIAVNKYLKAAVFRHILEYSGLIQT